MRKLDIDIVVSSTEIITKMIEQEVVNAGAQLLATLNKGKAAILSFTLPENSALDGYAIKDIKNASIISYSICCEGRTVVYPTRRYSNLFKR